MKLAHFFLIQESVDRAVGAAAMESYRKLQILVA